MTGMWKFGQQDMIEEANKVLTLIRADLDAPIGSAHAALSLDATVEDILDITAGTQILSADATLAQGDIIYADANPNWTILNVGSPNDYLRVSAGNVPEWHTLVSTDLPHALLSATHSDTTAQAVSRGSIVTGQGVTPTWNELTVGGAGDWLYTDGTDVSWRTMVATDLPAHDLLSAQHGDTSAAAVSRGSLVYGNSTPAWAELVLSAAGYALVSDGTDVAWDQTPAWSGLHTFNAGLLIGSGQTADLNGEADALVLDADGDTTISADTDDTIKFEISSADDFTMTANAFNVLTGSAIVMADGTTIGQAAGPLLTFDDTLNYLEITGAFVGINETTPTAHLHITSAGTVPCLVLNAGGEGEIATENTGVLRFGHWTSGTSTFTEHFHMNADGDLVLLAGTNLDVADNAWIGFSSSTGRIEFDDQTPDEINFLSCVVGLGTSTPGYPLHIYVSDSNTTPQILLDNDGAGDAIYGLKLTGGQGWCMGIDNSDADSLKFAPNVTDPGTNTILQLTTDYRMVVSSTVTGNDVVKVNVNAAAGNAAGGVHIQAINDMTDTSPLLKVTNTADANLFRVQEDGKVGIGAAAPASLVELNFATADLELVDAGTAGATEDGWIHIEIGGATHYIRTFTSI